MSPYKINYKILNRDLKYPGWLSSPVSSTLCLAQYASVIAHYWKVPTEIARFLSEFLLMPSPLQGMFFAFLFPKQFFYSSFRKTWSLPLLPSYLPLNVDELYFTDASNMTLKCSIKTFLSLY